MSFSMARRFGYTDLVIEHFRNPRNIGEMEDADVTAKVGSVACGDLIKLYVKIDDDTKKIEDISFESYGCAANIATSSMMTELVKGKTIEEARRVTYKTIAEALGGLPKVKVHCSVLSRQSLDAAFMKWEVKKGLREVDERFVRKILRGVLDPIEGVDIISAKMVEGIRVADGKIEIRLSVEEGTELAKDIEEDIKDAFEGTPLDLEVRHHKGTPTA